MSEMENKGRFTMNENEEERTAGSPTITFPRAKRALIPEMVSNFDEIEIEVIGEDEKFSITFKRTRFGEEITDWGHKGSSLQSRLGSEYGFGKVILKYKGKDVKKFPSFDEFIARIIPPYY
jgi:hypothetical protein